MLIGISQITTPEQSETNSDEFYVIDDNGLLNQR